LWRPKWDNNYDRLSFLPLQSAPGNVWEWTVDWYSQKHEADAPKACDIRIFATVDVYTQGARTAPHSFGIQG
jgi:formylglycine-generating enzyme required for sulfatase activity